jgi:hypothetical protein
MGKATFSNTDRSLNRTSLLEHHPHLAAQLVEALARERVDVAPDHLDGAARGLERAGDQLQQRRLARAAGAQDRDHAPARDVEVDAAQDAVAPVGEMQPADAHQVIGFGLDHASPIIGEILAFALHRQWGGE